MKRENWARLGALGLAICFVAGLDWVTNEIDIKRYSWDFKYYIDIATFGIIDNDRLVAPYVYRWLSPILASWIQTFFGVSLVKGFLWQAYLGATAQLFLLFLLLRHFQVKWHKAYLVMLLFACSMYHVKFLLFDVYRPDHLAYPLMLLAVLLYFKRQFLGMALVCAIGLQCREFLVIPSGLFVLERAWTFWNRSCSLRDITEAAGVFVIISLAVLIPRLWIPVIASDQYIDFAHNPSAVWQNLNEAVLQIKRQANVFFALLAYLLPLALLWTRKRWAQVWCRLFPIRWYLVGFSVFVCVLTVFGGTDYARFVTYLVVPIAIVMGRMLEQKIHPLEIIWLVIAMLSFHQVFADFPIWDRWQYLDFYGGWKDRFQEQSLLRIREWGFWVLGAVCLRWLLARLKNQGDAAFSTTLDWVQQRDLALTAPTLPGAMIAFSVQKPEDIDSDNPSQKEQDVQSENSGQKEDARDEQDTPEKAGTEEVPSEEQEPQAEERESVAQYEAQSEKWELWKKKIRNAFPECLVVEIGFANEKQSATVVLLEIKELSAPLLRAFYPRLRVFVKELAGEEWAFSFAHSTDEWRRLKSEKQTCLNWFVTLEKGRGVTLWGQSAIESSVRGRQILRRLERAQDSLDDILNSSAHTLQSSYRHIRDILGNGWSWIFAFHGISFTGNAEDLEINKDKIFSNSLLQWEDLLLFFEIAFLTAQMGAHNLQTRHTLEQQILLQDVAQRVRIVLKKIHQEIFEKCLKPEDKKAEKMDWVMPGVWFALALTFLVVFLYTSYRPFTPIQDLRNVRGKGGIVATYYHGTNQEKRVMKKRHKHIYIRARYAPHKKMNADLWSVRWQGYQYFPKSGEYYLCAKSDEGVRMFLSHRKIIDRWRGANVQTHCKKINSARCRNQTPKRVCRRVTLRKGWYPFRVDYFDKYGKAYLNTSRSRRPGRFPKIPSQHLCCKR